VAVGQVQSVGSTSFTLQTPRGTLTVQVTSSTRINGATSVKLSTLAGQVALVQGTQNSDGSVTATSVLTRGAAPGVGQGGGGAGSGTGGSAGPGSGGSAGTTA
jgi:hypothetical protein